jgi:hypothetical protein
MKTTAPNKNYMNWGFSADNKVSSPQQRQRGSTEKQPAIPAYSSVR